MLKRLIAILSLPLSIACGSIDSGSAEDGPDGGGPDHRADAGGDPETDASPGDPDGPTVLSVSPGDGAIGVAADAVIVVVFDRAMDRDSVEAAWSSEELPAGAIAFAWNQAGDTLTVTPDAPLPIAEGSGDDPDAVAARTFAFAIGTGATDTDGLRLKTAFDAGFATVRRLELELPYNDALTDSRLANNSAAPGSPTVEYAGDTSGNLQVKMMVSFSLPVLPAGAALESAVFSADQTTATANVFNSLAGGLEALHVRFSQMNSGIGAGSLGSVGVFSDSVASGPRSLDVTSAVADDIDDGVAYSQFRLEFPLDSNDDDGYDTAQFSRASLLLTISYLVD